MTHADTGPAGTSQAPGPRVATHVNGARSLELNTDQPRLLAVSSQLAHGAVGLNAAERVYADAGMRVTRIPTILLSVMPHYESVHHIDVSSGWITHALTDITMTGAFESLEIVTLGYLARVDQAEALAEWIAAAPETENRRVVLDPTLGDVEVGFYTDPALAGAIRDLLVPLGTGMTPNLFELAHLTGEQLDALGNLEAIERAARSLMTERTEWVIVTGIDVSADDRTEIAEMVVTPTEMTMHHHDKIDTAAKGVGDTFTAALNVALLAGATLDDAVNTAAAEVRARVL